MFSNDDLQKSDIEIQLIHRVKHFKIVKSANIVKRFHKNLQKRIHFCYTCISRYNLWGNMTILINKKINLTEDATPFIHDYLKHISSVNPGDIYEGLSDKQILKNKFIFKIYELENLDLVDIDLHVEKNQIYVLARFWNSKIINIGSIPLTNGLKIALNQELYPTLKIIGGNYKKVVETDFDKNIIVDGFDQYQLVLEVHQADLTEYKSQKIDKIYQQTFKDEHSLIALSKNLMRCFAVFGLLLGLGFMFLGFYLTGLMVIIAFFGVNSYTLLLADTHLQEQSQRVN